MRVGAVRNDDRDARWITDTHGRDPGGSKRNQGSEVPADRYRPCEPLTDDDNSTLTGVRTDREPGRALWSRRGATLGLMLLIIAGGAGFLGVRSDVQSGTESRASSGYQLSVTYPRIARAGWDVPLTIRVIAPEPFHQRPITLSINRAYLDMFETQGWHPEPSSSTGDAERVEMQFDTPRDAVEFEVDFDTYIQPSRQLGASARVALQVDDREVDSVSFHTTLLP